MSGCTTRIPLRGTTAERQFCTSDIIYRPIPCRIHLRVACVQWETAHNTIPTTSSLFASDVGPRWLSRVRYSVPRTTVRDIQRRIYCSKTLAHDSDRSCQRGAPIVFRDFVFADPRQFVGWHFHLFPFLFSSPFPVRSHPASCTPVQYCNCLALSVLYKQASEPRSIHWHTHGKRHENQ